MKPVVVLLLSLVMAAGLSAEPADDMAFVMTGDNQNTVISESPGQCCTTRGDFDGNGFLTAFDITFMMMYAFQNGSPPPCLENLDADANGKFNILDVIIIMRYLFSMGAAPVPC